jgi:hypothetical protein
MKHNTDTGDSAPAQERTAIPFKRPPEPRFTKAYTRIMRDSRISGHAKLLYVILKGYCDRDGQAFPSAETLAKCMTTGRRQVFRYLKELKEWRIIMTSPRIEGGKQSSNLYIMNDTHFARHLARKNSKRGVTQRTHKGGDTADTRSIPIEVEPSIVRFPGGA